MDGDGYRRRRQHPAHARARHDERAALRQPGPVDRAVRRRDPARRGRRQLPGDRKVIGPRVQRPAQPARRLRGVAWVGGAERHRADDRPRLGCVPALCGGGDGGLPRGACGGRADRRMRGRPGGAHLARGGQSADGAAARRRPHGAGLHLQPQPGGRRPQRLLHARRRRRGDRRHHRRCPADLPQRRLVVAVGHPPGRSPRAARGGRPRARVRLARPGGGGAQASRR